MDVYLSLGTNLGDKERNINTALDLISLIPGVRIAAVSDLLETEPWGFESSDNFLNCAVKLEFSYAHDGSVNEAVGLLDSFKDIERSMGRNTEVQFDNSGNRIYHSRIIDIDILFLGNKRIDTERLTIPHPLMEQRDFVMKPLIQIADEKIKSEFPEVFRSFL